MQYSESNLLVFEDFAWAVDSFLIDIKLYHTKWQKKVPNQLLVCGIGDL